MDRENSEGQASPGGSPESPQGETGGVAGADGSLGSAEANFPLQSPLFHAEHAGRYDRQALISSYEELFECRLIVMIDNIFSYSITLFEELIHDASPLEDLHVLLWTPGGDGEVAVRLVRSAQARCRRLTILVPDQAKSAGTLLAMGAHEILMGPTSDLGPIDPQMLIGNAFVSAKDIIAAVDESTRAVQQSPDTYPIHAALLADVNALTVQQAKSALMRTDDLAEEALKSNPDRSSEEVQALLANVLSALVEAPNQHAAVFGLDAAEEVGLPITRAEPNSVQWRMIWHLWTKYFALNQRAYEGRQASKVMPWPNYDS